MESLTISRKRGRELIKEKKVKSSRREYLNGRLSSELSSYEEKRMVEEEKEKGWRAS